MFPKINPANVLISKVQKKTPSYDVYSALDFSLSMPITLTLSKPCSQASLEYESQILTSLLSIPGVPQIYWSGDLNNRFGIITNQMTTAICEKISPKNRFSSENTAKLGVDLLQILEKVHARGVLHRNLSPKSVVSGKNEGKTRVFLRDFAHAQYFLDKNGRHVAFAKAEEFVGSVEFASCDAHDFLQQSRKSDLEALGFVLCFAFLGKLPWQDVKLENFAKKVRVVGEQKKFFVKNVRKVEELPGFLKEFFEKIANVGFFDEPNYKEIGECLEKWSGRSLEIEKFRDVSSGKLSDESTRMADGGSTISEKKREILMNSKKFAI